MPSQNRIAQINQELLSVLSALLPHIKDPRVREGLVTFTRVDCAGDLSLAKVYVSVLGADSAAVLAGLKSAAGFMRREAGRELQLRRIPELLFTADNSIERGTRLLHILDDIKDTPTDK